MRLHALVLTVLALLTFGVSNALSQSDHTNLGDDSIFDVTRDVSADILPSWFVPDEGAAMAAPASQAGCTTKFQNTNFSSRAGAVPTQLVAHYTVSRNVAGWSDVNAIWSFFDRAATDASAHYIIDFEGHCLYSVPEDAKAWTQGNVNPWAISIEFIAMGSERVWPDAALRKGARVFADAAKRWGIPIRLVNPDACSRIAGITDHNRLECNNTHTDVAPFFPMDKFIRYVKEAAAPPQQIVHFVLATGEQRGIAKSMGVVAGPNELARLRGFLDYRAPAALRELRADGDINVIRRKGKP